MSVEFWVLKNKESGCFISSILSSEGSCLLALAAGVVSGHPLASACCCSGIPRAMSPQQLSAAHAVWIWEFQSNRAAPFAG
jgi:hypothetical protein